MVFAEFHQTTIGDLLRQQAVKYSDRPYLTHETKTWTYAQANDLTDRLASGFIRMGLVPGDRLAILLPNIPEYVLSIFGAAKADLIVVPINIRRHENEVEVRLENTSSSAVIVFEHDHVQMVTDLRAKLSGLKHIISLTEDQTSISLDDLFQEGSATKQNQVRPENPAAIIHTLGSSGQPRGAILTHQGLVHNAADVAASLECSSDDIFLGAVPFSNAFGLTPTILACTVAGAKLVCLTRYKSSAAMELIEREKITVHHGVPSMFAMELNDPTFKRSSYVSLRTGIMSGAPCPPELVRDVRKKMGFDLRLAYGLTEASPSVTITSKNDGPITATETVGRPHPGIELKTIDTDGTKLPDQMTGELCVRGYNVMDGYWGDPIATNQVIDRDGWLHTGDLASIDPDGPVRIVGRKHEVIIREGIKIYPGTVEMVLRSYPGVKDAAVVGIPDLIYGELSCACIVRMPGESFTSEDLIPYIQARVSEVAVPDKVVFFDSLPRRGSGPVRKNYLRERVRIHGKAWCFGNNVDTDAIIPARRCNTADPRELAKYCMEDANPEFIRKMRRGDLIVAGSNFGCGSSREVAPVSIKAAGVSAVIAKSFARIFFRNAINIGLPILECPQAVTDIRAGDYIEVEPATGLIRNITSGEMYQAEPFPDFLQKIIDRGGLLAYVEDRLAQQQEGEQS